MWKKIPTKIVLASLLAFTAMHSHALDATQEIKPTNEVVSSMSSLYDSSKLSYQAKEFNELKRNIKTLNSVLSGACSYDVTRTLLEHNSVCHSTFPLFKKESVDKPNESEYAAIMYAGHLDNVPVFVTNDPDFNAMAIQLTNDRNAIILNKGLVQELTDPVQLKFILYHELGHLKNNHTYDIDDHKHTLKNELEADQYALSRLKIENKINLYSSVSNLLNTMSKAIDDIIHSDSKYQFLKTIHNDRSSEINDSLKQTNTISSFAL